MENDYNPFDVPPILRCFTGQISPMDGGFDCLALFVTYSCLLLAHYKWSAMIGQEESHDRAS